MYHLLTLIQFAQLPDTNSHYKILQVVLITMVMLILHFNSAYKIVMSQTYR